VEQKLLIRKMLTAENSGKNRDIEGESIFSPFLQVIHGLDELVFYYQNQPNSGLQHSLTHFVPGDECPDSVKLHGVENLLHRASAGGSLPVVSELLKCGNRDVRAKNHDGTIPINTIDWI
jgi:hypothetical protein